MSLDLLGLLRLAFFVGPWAPRALRPQAVQRREIDLGHGLGPARESVGPSYLYTPSDRPVRAAWLISPGLHADGPDDPRMDRFAAVLAASGTAVLSPRSPALVDLRLAEEVIPFLQHAARAFDLEPESAGVPLRVLGVSVGSLAALRLAADPDFASRIERLVLVGGYADSRALIASLCGADTAHRDPLNRPTVFLTCLDHLPVTISDRARLVAAWHRFVKMAWKHDAWKQPGATAYKDAAKQLASDVDPRDRELFLIGCAAEPGAHALIQAAFATGHYDYLDPRPYLGGVRAEVSAIHGLSDPVVPIEQLELLLAALPRTRPIRLGFFSHSRTVALSTMLRNLPRLVDEASAFAALMRALY